MSAILLTRGHSACAVLRWFVVVMMQTHHRTALKRDPPLLCCLQGRFYLLWSLLMISWRLLVYISRLVINCETSDLLPVGWRMQSGACQLPLRRHRDQNCRWTQLNV